MSAASCACSPIFRLTRSPGCEALRGAEINEAKKALATAATALAHGSAAAEEAAETARRTFEQGEAAATLPTHLVPEATLAAGIPLFRLLVEAGLAAEQRRSPPPDPRRRRARQRRRDRRRGVRHLANRSARRCDQAVGGEEAAPSGSCLALGLIAPAIGSRRLLSPCVHDGGVRGFRGMPGVGNRRWAGGCRMRWDSNPRNPCGLAGFQDRCLQPLGHSSRRGRF